MNSTNFVGLPVNLTSPVARATVRATSSFQFDYRRTGELGLCNIGISRFNLIRVRRSVVEGASLVARPLPTPTSRKPEAIITRGGHPSLVVDNYQNIYWQSLYIEGGGLLYGPSPRRKDEDLPGIN